MTIDINSLGRKQGSFLLQGMSISKTRNDSDMLQGSIIVRGGASIRFVCFDNVIVSQFKENGVTTIYVSDGDVTIPTVHVVAEVPFTFANSSHKRACAL